MKISQKTKQILLSILIGAVVAFLSSLFDGLLSFLKNHGNDLAGGAVATIYHITKTYKS